MHSANLRGILANSGWIISDKVIRMTLGVFVGAWVARYLGPSSFGELSFAIVYIGLFQTITTLGMDGFVVRDIARESAAVGDILGSAFVMRLVAGAVCWFIALVALWCFKGLGNPYVFLTAVVGLNLFFQAADTVDLWFQSQTQSRRTVMAKLAACVLSNAFKIALIMMKAPLAAFAAVLAFEIAAGALALRFVYKSFPAPAIWRYRSKQASRLLRESWPFVVSGGVNMIQARAEYVIIDSLMGAAALGQYAAAAKFIEVFDVVFASLAISIYPRIAKREQGEADETIRKVYLLAMITWILTIPMLFVIWFFMKDIYGANYDVARAIFPLMAIRPLLASIGTTKNIAIRLSFKSEYAVFSSAIGAVFACAAAYLTIPKYGLPAAVLSTLASFILSNFLIDRVFYPSNFRNIVFC